MYMSDLIKIGYFAGFGLYFCKICPLFFGNREQGQFFQGNKRPKNKGNTGNFGEQGNRT